MKKISIVLMAVLLATALFTCSDDLNEDGEVEYTDVVYSKDGSEITVYLDGVTVPVSKSQRAMTLDLAMMSYDYLEVVFVTTAGYSRSAWELGQPAGISGSGLRIANSDYSGFTGTQKACLFAGQKSGKTLFGVGKMIKSTSDKGVVTSTGAIPIDLNTASVTFGLAAIQTGLLVKDEAVKAPVTPTSDGKDYATHKIPVDSFIYTGKANTGFDTRTANSSRQRLLDGVEYPVYSLSTVPGDATEATYTFKFMTGIEAGLTTFADLKDVTSDYLAAVKHIGPTNPPKVQKRTPRFMDGGRYLQPNGHIDTKTKVAFRATYAYTNSTTNLPAADATFVNVVPLTFTTVAGSGGIFSFYLEIPVYNLDARNLQTADNLNGGPGPITWFIRTGLGSDLYSLDDGQSSGGCVFMSCGVSNSDWLEIGWEWIP